MIGKVINKSIQEIKENLEAYSVKVEYPRRPEGYRKEGYVYDEDQSVKWNREHREQLEKEYQDKQKEYREAENKSYVQFEHDLIRAIEKEYGLNYKQGEIIFKRAWEDGHADGLLEVAQKMADLAEFVEDVIKAK